ncbi:sel1 repeat domain-containing protein [Sarocladium implicatum]|nr:sel1 repeat domain-containing protein [Sarocladium implicatum]
MSSNFGATFVPGGYDDYYMPEVVAPAPQRVTPQVPQNMQEDLQRMELEASGPELHSESAQLSQLRREPSLSTYTTSHYDDPSRDASRRQADDNITAYKHQDANAGPRPKSDNMSRDAPNFSPFPKIQKSDNVPPADDEKEEILWNARDHVLHSHNVAMQITWARDVLNWAEVAIEAAAREKPPRPSTPRIEHELREDATRIITYLAEQEHPQALYIRAKWLEFGKCGNRVDKREAYNGYKKAAELGNARSEYRIGMLFEQSNDMTKAKEHYYKGLAHGDSAAMYRMGMMSLLGQHGEHKDYRSGIDRIQAAADSSDEDAPQGAFVYGMLAARDLPDIQVPEAILRQDLNTARMYIEKSAYQGFAKAQLKMGQAFELCQLGCDFNPAYSLHYYGLAAKQGLPEAALGVSRWFLFGYEGVFKKNEELAFKYATDAADAKLPTGQFALGYYHEIGIHVGKNLSEARRWYQLAADHGNTDAVGRLESLNEDKTLSKQDHETTTLTRIKSQHGSQRGKRPDRFKQPQQMPTLSEGSPSGTPSQDRGPYKGPSPKPSPGLRPTLVSDEASFPDPSRASYGSAYDDRQPAFNIRLDSGGGQPARPHSAAPYPVDDRPPPLNVRPRSTAPYPEDDNRPHPAQQRLNPGPQADRPGSAFGIKTGGPRPMPGSQSTGNLHPAQGPAGRGGGYRQASVGAAPQGYGGGPMQQRPSTTQPQSSGHDRYQMTGGLPAHPAPGGHGPRTSSRPQSEVPPSAHRPERLSSLPPDPRMQQRPATAQPRPGPNQGGPQGRMGTPGGVQSPPMHKPTPPPAVAQAGPAPPSKPSQGPATFEAMGIPQGKQEGDCVVM